MVAEVKTKERRVNLMNKASKIRKTSPLDKLRVSSQVVDAPKYNLKEIEPFTEKWQIRTKI